MRTLRKSLAVLCMTKSEEIEFFFKNFKGICAYENPIEHGKKILGMFGKCIVNYCINMRPIPYRVQKEIFIRLGRIDFYEKTNVKILSFEEFLQLQGIILCPGRAYFLVLSHPKKVLEVKKKIFSEETKNLFGFDNFFLTRSDANAEKIKTLSKLGILNE